MILKSKTFWLSTFLFIVVTVGLLWYGYPPAVRQLGDNIAKKKQLDADIVTQKEFLATIASLEQNKGELATLFETARLALPTKPQPEILLLQMDGLLGALGLGHVQLSLPVGSSSVSAPPVQTEEGEQPAKAAQTATQLTLTMTGDVSFDQVKALVDGLKTLARWNRVDKVDINTNSGKTSATITTQAYWKPGNPAEFSHTDSQFFTKAHDLFGSLQTHTTVPNATTEGQYGKANPFQ